MPTSNQTAEKAERIMLDRLLRAPCSVLDLMHAAESGVDPKEMGPLDSRHRHAERFAQRLRKAGHAAFARVGRRTIWSMTDAGRQHYAQPVTEDRHAG